MDTSLIKRLIDEALAINPELFLVDWSISDANQIDVFVDGDHGIDLEEIIRISRHIEHNEALDREVEDFALSVSTPGATSPIKHHRQYTKNIGRTLEIRLRSGETAQGELTDVAQDKINIQWNAREPKPIGKGKVTVLKQMEIPLSDIKQAKVLIEF